MVNPCHTIQGFWRVFDVRPVDPELDVSDPLVESFDAFYLRERRSMVALAYATSRSRLAAEDIAHDALLAAFRDWERIRRLDNPATWVRRIVVNMAVSTVRVRVREAKAMARLLGRAETSHLLEVSPEAELIWAAVGRLSKRQKQVIALRYVSELSLSQIGEVLGCSKETANTHLRRARLEVSRRLEIEEEDL